MNIEHISITYPNKSQMVGVTIYYRHNAAAGINHTVLFAYKMPVTLAMAANHTESTCFACDTVAACTIAVNVHWKYSRSECLPNNVRPAAATVSEFDKNELLMSK